MPEQPQGARLTRLREYVTAGLAALVVVGSLSLVIIALGYVDTPESFARVKDLLLIVNPVLGLVLGYYFNRTTTEARAEHAERTAEIASRTASESLEARRRAETDAQAARSQWNEMRSTLEDVSTAASDMMNQAPPASRTLGGEPGTGRDDETRLALQVALARAQRLLT
ncbi:MAG: hypothetical protein KBD01_05560 [Acidobacteria bacterium]|nr:hypothetical protein [Acidobacteriota bacterium]